MNEEILNCAKEIKKYCLGRKCDDCVFEFYGACGVYEEPSSWDLRKRKTKKDVLLEKFPNARLKSDDTPNMCIMCIGFDYPDNCSYDQCEECWNSAAGDDYD